MSIPSVKYNSQFVPGLGATQKPVILFYCQSSLGIGHTMRSIRLLQGMAEKFDVHFANGGEVIDQLTYPENINIVNLPPIKADPEFSSVHCAKTGDDPEPIFQQRAHLLIRLFEQVKPQILMVELYPFGRGAFKKELDPVLELAKKRDVKTICSLRDILVDRADTSAYEEKVVNRMNRYFDMLLVHSDPNLFPLDKSFSRLSDIRSDIRYTGYVAPKKNAAITNNVSPSIIVSIGGGRFGHELADAVIDVAPILLQKIPHSITVATGPFCPKKIAARLQRKAANISNLTITDFIPELHSRLLSASLSISMGGYNTTMDVLASGVRAMMMPCVNNGGMDQKKRLDKLAQLGIVDLIMPEDLLPDRLVKKILDNLNKNQPQTFIDLNGVDNTTAIIANLSSPSVKVETT